MPVEVDYDGGSYEADILKDSESSWKANPVEILVLSLGLNYGGKITQSQ